MSDQDAVKGILAGLALGDALGWPIEFLNMQKINTIYGPGGIKEPPNPAQVTDDTQTSLVIAEALVEAGHKDIESLMAVVTRRLIEWSNSPDNDRAPGHTVTEAVRTLEAGVPWRESGGQAKGNGSAIRVASIGFFYQHNPDRLREVAHATGIATHAHPASDAATIAAAYAVKLALDGTNPADYINKILAFTNGISGDLDDALLRIGHVLEWTDEFAAINHIGDGWVGEQSVAMALYCVLRYPDDFAGAVRRAVNIPGDSDSVGCIAGGIMGARLGISGVPSDWVARLENRDALLDLADQLVSARSAKS
jgi:ADP-ribosylglycohydrolase